MMTMKESASAFQQNPAQIHGSDDTSVSPPKLQVFQDDLTSLIARELNSLSLTEREEILDEIHGVSGAEEEDFGKNHTKYITDYDFFLDIDAPDHSLMDYAS